jgi:voltage-gated potassium channel Kch
VALRSANGGVVATPPQQPRGQSWIAKRIRQTGVRPRDAAFVIVVAWTAAIVVFGVVEHLVDRKTFGSVWLGMWWGVQTVTSVGYGDIVPGQTIGQVFASLLMLGGLSLLAVFIAAITSAFVTAAENERREAGDDPVMRQLAELRSQLDQVQAELARRQGGT